MLSHENLRKIQFHEDAISNSIKIILELGETSTNLYITASMPVYAHMSDNYLSLM